MKKIFAIVGSFRKGGNTELIIDKVIEGARNKGAEVKKVFIDDLTVGSCQGCLDCRKEGQCSVKDDFSTIIEEINSADGVVVGSPIYGNYMTGQLKILLDRMMGVINKVTYGPQGRISETRLEKKLRNILIVMTAGAPNEDCAEDSLKLIRRMFSSMTNNGFFDELIATNINPKGAIIMEITELEQLARLKGSKSPEEDAKVLKEANERILERAYILGNQLVEGREDEESIDKLTMLTGNNWV